VLLLRIEKKNLCISSLHVEKCSDILTFTNQFISLVTAMTNARCILRLNRVYIHTHKNKDLLLLKIEELKCYIWTCVVEYCSGFILVNMGFHKSKHLQAIHSLLFGISIFRIVIARIKSCYFQELKRKTYIYQLGTKKKSRFFILITMAFHKFRRFHAKRPENSFVYMLTKIKSSYF
jgi:hypothetical protein